jgi:rubrerythrin
MALSDELCGILAMGAEKERAAHVLYLEAANKTKHPLGRQMFERLAAEETKHEELLKAWAHQGLCPMDVDFEHEIDADFMKRAHAKLDEVVKCGTGDLEAIELGRQMERKAIAFYQEQAAKTGDKNSKALFLRLVAEENKHLALLTDLYGYLSNPTVWQTREGKAHFDS